MTFVILVFSSAFLHLTATGDNTPITAVSLLLQIEERFSVQLIYLGEICDLCPAPVLDRSIAGFGQEHSNAGGTSLFEQSAGSAEFGHYIFSYCVHFLSIEERYRGFTFDRNGLEFLGTHNRA